MKQLILFIILITCLALCGCRDSNCVSGNCTDGQGIWISADGSRYVGQWKNGKMHGLGTYTYPDGTLYKGEWADGKMNGQGTLKLSGGVQYVGGWKNDLMDGHGILTFPDKSYLEGKWQDGKILENLSMSAPASSCLIAYRSS